MFGRHEYFAGEAINTHTAQNRLQFVFKMAICLIIYSTHRIFFMKAFVKILWRKNVLIKGRKKCTWVINLQQIFTLICDTITKIKFGFPLAFYLQRVVWVRRDSVCLITSTEFRR